MIKALKKFWKDEDGLSMTEYAIIAAVVAAGAVGAFSALGGNITSVINTLAGEVSTG